MELNDDQSHKISSALRDAVLAYMDFISIMQSSCSDPEVCSSKKDEIRNKVEEALREAVLRAVSGQKTCKKFGHEFFFHYEDKNFLLVKPKPEREESVCLEMDKFEGGKRNGHSEAEGCVYERDGRQNSMGRRQRGLPERVSFFKNPNPYLEKDAIQALSALLDHLSTHIFSLHPETLAALTGAKIDQERWIKSTLGLVLVNVVFYNELAEFNYSKDECRRKISEKFKANGPFSSRQQVIDCLEGLFDLNWDIILENDDSLTILEWAGYYSPDVFPSKSAEKLDKKIIKLCANRNLPAPKFVEIDNHIENTVEKPMTDPENNAPGWAALHYGGLDEALSHEEFIVWQKSAFFWEPECREKIKLPKEVSADNPGRKKYAPVSIGFFYSWLRLWSGATLKNIAAELTRSNQKPPEESTIQRWQPEAPLLKESFPIPVGREKDGWRFLPLWFEPAARENLHLYNKKIRFNPSTFPDIVAARKSKKRLWNIYDLVRKEDILATILETRTDCPISGPEEEFSFMLKLSPEPNAPPDEYFLCICEIAQPIVALRRI